VTPVEVVEAQVVDEVPAERGVPGVKERAKLGHQQSSSTVLWTGSTRQLLWDRPAWMKWPLPQSWPLLRGTPGT
jgi:hypothetical protein